MDLVAHFITVHGKHGHRLIRNCTSKTIHKVVYKDLWTAL